MRNILRAVYHLLTGIFPENIQSAYTRGTGALQKYFVVFGQDSIGDNLLNIPASNYPLIIVDLADGEGQNIGAIRGDMAGGNNGMLESVASVSIQVIARVNGTGKAILGDGNAIGVVDAFEAVKGVLLAHDSGSRLIISNVPYADEIVYPITVSEGYGVDAAGKVFARARKFTIKYRYLELV